MNAQATTYNPLALSFSKPGANTVARDFLLVLGGSLLVALLAQISLRLPFTPVPITGQTLGVLLVGASLGSGRGALSLILYIMMAIAGLPVLPEGMTGLHKVIGVTGGYFIGFVLAAYVIGRMAEQGFDRKIKPALVSFLVGHVSVFVPGLIWLGLYTGQWDQVFAWGFFPFIPGLILKTVIAAGLLPTAWRLVDRCQKTGS